MPDDDDHEEHQPSVEATGDGSGSDNPRRPTAVGAGSPDDDFEKRIAELRRYYVNALKEFAVPPDKIQSWPVSGLTFVRIDGIMPSGNLEGRQREPNALSKGMYLMEDALAGLNSQNVNVAFLIVGSKACVNFYMGISLQSASEELQDNDFAEDCYEIQKSILHSVYNGVDVNEKSFSVQDLQSLVEPLAGNVGVVSGLGSLKSAGDDTLESEQIERIASGLLGLDFGMLILATPVPSRMVSDEEHIILDEMQKAQENEAVEARRRVEFYLELQNAYLKHLQLGQAIGLWQVGVYFFAPKPDVFVRLQSLVRASYGDDGTRPTPFLTHVFPGLKDHLMSFGLLRNRQANTALKLLSYKFLSLLNSRMLSAYIHLPKRDMVRSRLRSSTPYCIEPCKLKTSRSLALGNLLDRGMDTGNRYLIDLDALCENMIITGVAGSGKTNLAISICDQLFAYKIPFLVIEPTGSTFRSLLLSPENLKYGGQVFTAGDNAVSPFKFNPLEILNAVNPSAHIQSLVSIFAESLGLTLVGEKIIEEALKSLYVEHGWNLNATAYEPSAHTALDESKESSQVQPTLKEFVNNIGSTAKVMYVPEELESAKILSTFTDLAFGNGGSLFDSRNSISPDQLFQNPTVVEFKTFSNKTTKSILVKLLLLFLAEYRQSKEIAAATLQHVLVVENAGLAGSLLLQITGSGVIAIEQCPSQLPNAFLKNACVKVAHRLVAVCERDCMSSAMDLNYLQARDLASVGQGRSIVCFAPDTKKCQLEFGLYKSQSFLTPDTSEESDDMVREVMRGRVKPR